MQTEETQDLQHMKDIGFAEIQDAQGRGYLWRSG